MNRQSLARALPPWLYRGLRSIKREIVARKRVDPLPINITGDRDIEWSWVGARIPPGPGKALDFGSGISGLALVAAIRGFDCTAIDLEEVTWPYTHPRLHFVRGDVLTYPFKDSSLDLVINCSTVEHVGLVGRYSVVEPRPDGDLEAMARLNSLMKPGAIMLLTIPLGRDAVFSPYCRIYGPKRLPRLLERFLVDEEAFWIKDRQNVWVEADKASALTFEARAEGQSPLQTVYALGCFTLRCPHRSS